MFKMFKKILISFTLALFMLSCGGGGDDSTNNDTNEEALEQIKSPMRKSSVPFLLVLVSYDDIEISTTEDEWSQKIFGSAFHELNNYFDETSKGKFQLTPAQEVWGTPNDGVISVSLNKNHPNIDINNLFFMQLVYPDFIAALTAADTTVDFSSFDTNNDGKIAFDELAISFIFAGYEDAYEGWHVNHGIWAHSSCLSSTTGSVTLDNVSLIACKNDAKFSVFGELHNKNTPHIATNGLIAHELGHAIFDLPDLYNTYASNGGIGYFGLMGSGIWTVQNSAEFAGETPTHLSAWSKIYNRWAEPLNVSGVTSLEETNSLRYNIIKIPIDANHYYLLENRNNSGYDKGLFSLSGTFDGGIAIWKINEHKLREENFDANNVNNITEDKAVDIVEAIPGTIDSTGSGGDENALYYEGNKNYFLDLVDTISPRASTMTLNVKQ
jgi:M6 family metalloprotease-like protein